MGICRKRSRPPKGPRCWNQVPSAKYPFPDSMCFSNGSFDGIAGRQSIADGGRFRGTLRVTPATWAHTARNVVDDVVVTGTTYAAGNIVEPETISNLPGDVVVSARAVAAHTHGSDQLAGGRVEG